MSKLSSETELTIDHYLDTQGLICPEPVMLLHKSIRHANAGDLIEVLATDPATTRDIPNFCRHLGHQLLVQQTLAQTLDKDNRQTHLNSADDIDSSDNSYSSDNTANISHYRYVIQKKQA